MTSFQPFAKLSSNMGVFMFKILLGFAFISITSFANAGVYQCKVNGNLVFQDKPCAGGRETIGDRIKEQNAQIKKETEIDKKEQLRRQQWEDKSKSAQKEFNKRPFPYIGMPSTTKSVWGDPATKNITTTANGTKEQWVYRHGNSKAKYLYFINGVLTAISK